LAKHSIRIFVVDNYEPFRRFVESMICRRPEFQIVGESADGLDAVRGAAELQPDLILLDIGLPSLNGIGAARQILQRSPNSKILFVSGIRSHEIVGEALKTGGGGYLLKSDAGRELFAAIDSVLQGNPFRSSSLTGHHEVLFYSHDRQLIGKLSDFVEAALTTGNAAVVVATASHQKDLLQSLQAHGMDIATAIKQGRYLTMDATDALSAMIVNGVFEPDCFMGCFGALINKAMGAVGREHGRVAGFGECVDSLLKQGNHEAVIQDEKLGSRLCEMYPVDILCGYSIDCFEKAPSQNVIHQICAEHSAVHRFDA